MKLSALFMLATAAVATADGPHGGHGHGGPLVKRDHGDINNGVAAFLKENGLVQRDTCETKCLPEMCIDEAIIKGSTTVVTYICPQTPTPTATVSKGFSTQIVTVTEYTTVPAPTSAVTPTSQIVPQVSSSASPMPVVTSSTSSVEPMTTITHTSTIKTTITVHKPRTSSVTSDEASTKAPILTPIEMPTETSMETLTSTASAKAGIPFNTSGFQWPNATTTATNAIDTIGTGISTHSTVSGNPIGIGISTHSTVSGNPMGTGISTHFTVSAAPLVTNPIMTILTTFNRGLRTANATRKVTVIVTPSPKIEGLPWPPHMPFPKHHRTHAPDGPSSLAFPSLEVNGTAGVHPSGQTTPCATGSAPIITDKPTYTIYKTAINHRRHDVPHTDSWNSTLTEGALAPPAMPTGTEGTVGTVGTVSSHVHKSEASGTAPAKSSWYHGINQTHHVHPTKTTESVEEVTGEPPMPAMPAGPAGKPPIGGAGSLSASLFALFMGLMATVFL